MKSKPLLSLSLIVGCVWALVQFGISEGLYRSALLIDESGLGVETDGLYDISDMVAWPAGLLYEAQERREVVAALRELDAALLSNAEAESMNPEALALSIEGGGADVSDSVDMAYDLLSEQSIFPVVSTAAEYSIYAGVCFAWGTLLGMLTFVFLFIQGDRRPQQGFDFQA